ncbi:hypothetical protein CLOBOL_01971 [Enterocloster bolteae ATCC BAA-613]|uniref:Uncharacterized protein n=1 Tax=Enterocloster bolteae (strain ATCC BAA-613 / DSM 15670 / CCUG 46953 / JCM 12243 / WAL 16351) TaxID=411902 RepID=A8RMN8_ENTBW|nr:hypothetical protein CLOBOL_01971 [Enterocloster bolteae ATCC BAA-613]
MKDVHKRQRKSELQYFNTLFDYLIPITERLYFLPISCK